MPFIRYKIDDRGTLSDEECACGRKLQMFKNIEGRISDIITSPSGRHISLYFFSLIFQVLSDYVKEFQVQQKKSSIELVLNIVPTKKYNNSIETKLISQVKNMDEFLDVSINLVEEIPLETTGKKNI